MSSNSEELSAELQAQRFLNQVAVIHDKTLLDTSTILDLLAQGWTYNQATSQWERS